MDCNDRFADRPSPLSHIGRTRIPAKCLRGIKIIYSSPEYVLFTCLSPFSRNVQILGLALRSLTAIWTQWAKKSRINERGQLHQHFNCLPEANISRLSRIISLDHMSRDVRGNRNHPDLLTRPRVDEKPPNALANVRPPTTPASGNQPQALRHEPDTRFAS